MKKIILFTMLLSMLAVMVFAFSACEYVKSSDLKEINDRLNELENNGNSTKPPDIEVNIPESDPPSIIIPPVELPVYTIKITEDNIFDYFILDYEQTYYTNIKFKVEDNGTETIVLSPGKEVNIGGVFPDYTYMKAYFCHNLKPRVKGIYHCIEFEIYVEFVYPEGKIVSDKVKRIITDKDGCATFDMTIIASNKLIPAGEYYYPEKSQIRYYFTNVKGEITTLKEK